MSSGYGEYNQTFAREDNDNTFTSNHSRNANIDIPGSNFADMPVMYGIGDNGFSNTEMASNPNYDMNNNTGSNRSGNIDDDLLMNNVINYAMDPAEIEKHFHLEMFDGINPKLSNAKSNSQNIENDININNNNQYNNDFNEMNRAISNVDINSTQYTDFNNNSNDMNRPYYTDNSNEKNYQNIRPTEMKTPTIQEGSGSGSGSGIPSNSSYQSPAPVLIVSNNNTSTVDDEFSPESLGFSSNFASHQLTKSISNTLARSYGDQLGSSLNNLVSPASTFDGIPDSSYGSYDDSFLKSPINSPSLKSMGSPSSLGTHLNPKSALSKESKLSRRRELHNAVERRRRDLIKEKIKELGSLIPPTMMYEADKAKSSKDVKVNKNIILQKSVEYMMYLHEILEAQDAKVAAMQEEIEHLSLNDTGDQTILNNNQNNATRDTLINEINVTPNLTNNNFTQDNSSNSFLNLVNGNESSVSNTGASNFDLNAFSDHNAPRSVDSKLKFMDFSNSGSEPLDFSKLSDSGLRKLDDTNNKSNDMLSFGFRTGMSNTYNESNLNPSSNMYTNTQDDFNNFLNEPTLKFESDADFLDQLLSKDPKTNKFN